MFAAVRRYATLDNALVDALVGQEAAIRDALLAGPGSIGCEVVVTRDGLLVVAVGEDETSVVEAGRRFAALLDRSFPVLHAVLPEVWAGEVIVHAGG